MDVKIEESWKNELHNEFNKSYFVSLVRFVKEEYQAHTVFPPAHLIFNAFNKCPFDKVKVVIVGQDPYHNPGQANGLSFSVNDNVKIPPSLNNIYKEINAETGNPIPDSGNLERWSEQGVLMLNAILTVRSHQPGSHQKKGWEEFTDNVIRRLNEKCKHIVFILWGAYAQRKGESIDQHKHLVLTSAHPSPFSAHKGFFGNRHFVKTNAFLISKGIEPIDW